MNTERVPIGLAAKQIARAPSVLYGWVKTKQLKLSRGKVVLAEVTKLSDSHPRRQRKGSPTSSTEPTRSAPPTKFERVASIMRSLYPNGFAVEHYTDMVVAVATVQEMVALAERSGR